MSKWSDLFTQTWKEGPDSTFVGVGFVCTPPVKLSVMIRIFEADYLYIRSSFVNTHFL